MQTSGRALESSPMNNVHYSSASDDWETPQFVFDMLNQEFALNVDVCASTKNHKLPMWFSQEEDGLSKDWCGSRCWMNPPYGREIGKWVKKAATGGAEVVVALLPSRTDTAWWHDYIQDEAEVRFIRGRLKFGESKNSAPFPSCIVVFRGDYPT